MRALFVYKYLDLGGVEAVLSARLDGLPDLGVDAHVWFLRDGPGRALFEDKPTRTHIGGIHELERYLDAASPDLVITIDTEEAFPALRGVTADQAVVIEIHTPYRENRLYLSGLDRLGVRAFLTPTAYQASLVEKQTQSVAPTYVVPNPLDASFAEPLHSPAVKPRVPVVAWVGRLDALKRWRDFIGIANVMNRGRDAEAEFWLVGKDNSGGGEARLMLEAIRKGVLHRLRWYRDIPHARMARFFDALRESGGVVVSTSSEESFGLGVAEAMARGCAVVVPRRSAFREVVEDRRHGLMYRPDSATDAAKCIRRLLEDNGLREACGSQARADILDRHAPQKALPRLAETLQMLSPGQ